MNLADKVALVTGAAHRVGKAIALALAREGMNVVVHYGSSSEEAQQTVREIKSLGGRALPFQADLRQPEQIEALFAAAAQEFGRLDVLVNSAANFIKEPFEAVTLESWTSAFQTNLRAPFLCMQHAARLMRRTPRPPTEPAAIVNISDLLGVFPRPDFVQHGTAKAALIHLTQVAAVALGPEIRVNAVAPGAVLPPQGREGDAAWWQRMGERVPLRRTGDPGDVAQTVVFLARMDYLTGVLIPVDGGEHLVGPG